VPYSLLGLCRAHREVIERVTLDYRASSLAQKMRLLDRMVAVTGYAFLRERPFLSLLALEK
jgi:hypothetical protein